MINLARIILVFCLILNQFSTSAIGPKKPNSSKLKSKGTKNVNAQLKEFHQKGILFFAKGNSPEWSFEVDQSKNKIIRFLSSSGMIFTAAFEEPFQNFNSADLHYNIKSVLGHLKVVMKPKKSKLKGDSLTYTYQVIVDVKYEQDPNYQHYEGVGMFVPDFKFEGKWLLESLNGQIHKIDKLNPAHLIIDFPNSNYYGFNTCNSISGEFICEGKKKQFKPGLSTLKACEGLLEAEFTRAILGAVFVEIKNNKLVLSDSKSELAVFVR